MLEQHSTFICQADGSVAVHRERPSLFALEKASSGVASLSTIRTEIADAERFLSLQEQWSDLVLRAAEPNPFLHPIMVAASLADVKASDVSVVLAWQGERLVGVWAFICGKPPSGMPVRVLKAPIHPILSNATPVIDSKLADYVLSSMLDAIGSAAILPKIISVSCCDSDGPVMSALQRICVSRGRQPAILKRGKRPHLTCEQNDAAGSFAQALSSSRRRKLGQLRRRLARRGHVELKVHRDRGAVSESLERFMQLEAEGWKGARGSTFLGTTGATFARRAVPHLAIKGLAEIWELSFNGNAVSMAIILRQKRTAFDWKITYDETCGDCSPGVLLAQDYTASFLSEDTIDRADSCASDDTGLLGPLWTGRQGMVDFLLDCRGSSASFIGLAAIETCYANARRLAKSSTLLARKLGHF